MRTRTRRLTATRPRNLASMPKCYSKVVPRPEATQQQQAQVQFPTQITPEPLRHATGLPTNHAIDAPAPAEGPFNVPGGIGRVRI